jgi:hypothetical protein
VKNIFSGCFLIAGLFNFLLGGDRRCPCGRREFGLFFHGRFLGATGQKSQAHKKGRNQAESHRFILSIRVKSIFGIRKPQMSNRLDI